MKKTLSIVKGDFGFFHPDLDFRRKYHAIRFHICLDDNIEVSIEQDETYYFFLTPEESQQLEVWLKRKTL